MRSSSVKEIFTKAVNETYETVLETFLNNKRVSYSRFGDGDIMIMMGMDQQNHYHSKEIEQEVKESFSIQESGFLKGIAVNYPIEKGMAYGLFAPYVRNEIYEDYILQNFDIPKNYRFESAWFFHYLCVYESRKAKNLLNQVIRPKRKMFIGNIPKASIEQLIGNVDVYVETPFKDAYSTIDEWWPKVEEHLKDVDLVIPACGIAGRVVNKRIWNTKMEIQSFDIGSVVDAVDVRKSRKWIRLLGHRVQDVLINKPSLKMRIRYFYKEIFFRIRWLVKKNKKEKLS